MAEYNRWMNQRLYDAASKLPESEVLRDRGAFFGSILQTLNHIAVADTIWLHRFATATPESWLNSALLPYPQPSTLRQEIGRTLHELRAYREGLDQLIIDWSSRLTAEQLSTTLVYGNVAGQRQAKNFGALVLHFFNHQTHHRGQATTLFFQAGVDVGVTDLLAVIPSEIEFFPHTKPRSRMPNLSPNAKLISDAFDEMAKGNGGPFWDACHEDLVLRTIGTGSWSGEFSGKKNIVDEVFRPLNRVLVERATIPTRIIDGGDVIVVQAKGKNLTRDGQRYDNDYVFVLHLEHGKIVRYEEYCDTELIAKVLPDRIAVKSLPR